jgi:hypothetical protein
VPDTDDFDRLILDTDPIHNPAGLADDLANAWFIELWDDSTGFGKPREPFDGSKQALRKGTSRVGVVFGDVGEKIAQIKSRGG